MVTPASMIESTILQFVPIRASSKTIEPSTCERKPTTARSETYARGPMVAPVTIASSLITYGALSTDPPWTDLPSTTAESLPITAQCASRSPSLLPQSTQYPSNLNPYMPLSSILGKTSLSIETKPFPIWSRTAWSSAYTPALIRLEKASSFFGFSWNLRIRESLSSSTTPNGVTSWTGHSDMLANAFFCLWNLMNWDRFSEDTLSPLMTRKSPSRRFSTFLTAPPVPSGSGSSTSVILRRGLFLTRYSSITLFL